METVFDQLRTLQDILSEKYAIERELNENSKGSGNKGELINRLKRAYADKNNKLAEAEERCKKIRFRLEEAQLKREAMKNRWIL